MTGNIIIINHLNMTLQELIVHYGYLALFVGTFLEGETILIIAGYLAQDEFLDLPLVIVAAWLGSFAGDQTFFFIGRYKGIRFLDHHPGLQRNADKAFKLLLRHQIAVILGFRFLYGIRNVTPFVIGTSGYNPLRFFVLNLISALVWAIAFASFGYHLGNMAETILDDVEKYEKTILAAGFTFGLIYFLWRNLRKNNRHGNGRGQ